MASVPTNGSMKAIVAAVIPFLAALESYFACSEVRFQRRKEWAVAITGFITAVVVYFVPNQDAGVLRAAKAISAAVIPLVSALIQWGITGGAPSATVFIGVSTAILMYFVQPGPNTE